MRHKIAKRIRIRWDLNSSPIGRETLRWSCLKEQQHEETFFTAKDSWKREAFGLEHALMGAIIGPNSFRAI